VPGENFPHANRGGADKSGEGAGHAVTIGDLLPVARLSVIISKVSF
jgi:hypothetical protein